MLRSITRIKAGSRLFIPACFMETRIDKTREILEEIEDFIQPTPKPVKELRGMEKEMYEPEVFVDESGAKVSPLGHSRSFITRLQEPISIEPQEMRYRYRQNKMKVLRIDQQYNQRALAAFGPDLLAAIFLLNRDAKVKFIEENDWLAREKYVILTCYNKENHPRIEAIDASGCSIVFEGFDYLRGLKHIRYLDLSNSHRLDDHCLYKLAFHLPTLEYLNVSNCPNISERGLATLHALKNLKKLVVHNVAGVTLKQLVCLLLEESNPSLFIDGVTYSKDNIEEEIEEDRKKYEARYRLSESVDYDDKYLTNNLPIVRILETVLRYMPKSNENGFLAKFFGVRAPNEHLSRIKDGF